MEGDRKVATRRFVSLDQPLAYFTRHGAAVGSLSQSLFIRLIPAYKGWWAVPTLQEDYRLGISIRIFYRSHYPFL